MEQKLLVGWAERDVTPDRAVNLMGQVHMRITQEVKDPLTVTALALAREGAAPGAAVVFLSADTAHIAFGVNQQIQQIVERQIPELATEQIIIHATHTHTAPMLTDDCYPPAPTGVMTGKEYADFFTARAAEAIVAAWRNRRPAQVSWGLGQAVVGRNRRAVYFDDLSERPDYVHMPGLRTERFARMYGNTNDKMFSHVEGYEDHSVDLLFTWDDAGKLTGVVVNLACPSQETESINQISADFWHETRAALRQRLGENLFILPQCAAAGDQSPHLLWYKEAENRMLALKGIDRREEIARRVSATVTEVLPAVQKDARGSLLLQHIVKTIELPRRLISEAEINLVRADLAQLEAQPPSSSPDPARQLADNCRRAVSLMRCRLALRRYERQQSSPTLPVDLHVVRLGEIAWVSCPYELFLDYGIRIKARSPALQTFLIQLAATDHPQLGWDGFYLPTERAERGESYSANIYCNAISPAGGQVFVEEALRALAGLWQA